MLRRRFLRFLCLIAVGLALSDSIADSVICESSEAACHACACGPRLVSPAVIEVAVAAAPPSYVSYKPPTYAFLLQKSLLRPPCLAV